MTSSLSVDAQLAALAYSDLAFGEEVQPESSDRFLVVNKTNCLLLISFGWGRRV